MAETLNLFDRILDLIVTPEAARRISKVHLDRGELAQLEELREKANDGQLSEGERVQYEEFVEANDLLMLLQRKAQSVLEDDV